MNRRDYATKLLNETEIIDAVTSMGKYLFNKQVIAKNMMFTLNEGEEKEFEYYFTRENPGPYLFKIKKEGETYKIKPADGEEGELTVRAGEFFRLYPGEGVRDPGKGEGGITYYIACGNDEGNFCERRNFNNVKESNMYLIAYDRGGIWEDYVNMEAFRYEPQVAGTYYADAYSAYTFAWMAASGYGDDYWHAAALALDFVKNIYPRYEATYLDGMPHCDFKNPAYMETVEELMVKKYSPEELSRWRELYPKLTINEEYSPTNVYALRYHWWSAYNHYCAKLSLSDCFNKYEPEELLPRLKEDQTPDGLIQDNHYSEISFGGYSDAFDLTYHLYALSWLARGYDYMPLEDVWNILKKGAAFSLSLVTPGGEASYLGRSANNIYHLISGIYVFLRVAREDQKLAPRYYRAARKIFDYFNPFRMPEGNYPVALNDYPQELMGWSHCQTPYNATNAYFLIRCLPLLPAQGQKEEPLELEAEALLFYPDSRHAALSNSSIYAVIFAGSDISPYPHSGVHNTGVAGLAVLGLQQMPSLLPILEQSLREEEWSTSDLPDIVNEDDEIEVPINRGNLILKEDKRAENGIIVNLEYGGFNIKQEYYLEGSTIKLQTRLVCLREGRYRLVGAPGLSVRTDEGHAYELNNDGFNYRGPHGAFEFKFLKTTLPQGEWEVMDESSTGRGWHQKIAWCVEHYFEKGEEYTYVSKIKLFR